MTRIEKAAILLRMCEIAYETAKMVGDKTMVQESIQVYKRAQETFDDVVRDVIKTDESLVNYLTFLRLKLFD